MNIDIIDIEEFSKENKRIPKGCKYKIKVDKTKYVVDNSTITGKEILELAGKTPYTKWMLNQRVRGGGVVRVAFDEEVDLTTPGIEKFQTLPMDQTDGELRKQFSLPEEDSEFLENLSLSYETIMERNAKWLILHNFQIPEGYNIDNAQAAIKIENGYPVAQLDMIYFNPPLVRKDNRQIKALANMVIDGKNYQRWSRHRTPQNPWRPGIDDISTHISLAKYWLEREIQN